MRRDRHMLAVIGHVGHPHKRALVHAVNTRQFEMPIGEMQSAAVRRLAAMMQRDDDEAEQVGSAAEVGGGAEACGCSS